jgi:hypothetical protein
LGTAGKAIYDGAGHPAVNAANGASATLNLGAAALNATATGTGSIPAAIGSNVLWGAAAATSAGAGWAERRYAAPRPGDIEANHPSEPGSAA